MAMVLTGQLALDKHFVFFNLNFILCQKYFVFFMVQQHQRGGAYGYDDPIPRAELYSFP
jgi:hypothetical protein